MSYKPLTDEQLKEAEKSWGEAPLEVFEQARRANRLAEAIESLFHCKPATGSRIRECRETVDEALAAYRGVS